MTRLIKTKILHTNMNDNFEKRFAEIINLHFFLRSTNHVPSSSPSPSKKRKKKRKKEKNIQRVNERYVSLHKCMRWSKKRGEIFRGVQKFPSIGRVDDSLRSLCRDIFDTSDKLREPRSKVTRNFLHGNQLCRGRCTGPCSPPLRARRHRRKLSNVHLSRTIMWTRTIENNCRDIGFPPRGQEEKTEFWILSFLYVERLCPLSLFLIWFHFNRHFATLKLNSFSFDCKL